MEYVPALQLDTGLLRELARVADATQFVFGGYATILRDAFRLDARHTGSLSFGAAALVTAGFNFSAEIDACSVINLYRHVIESLVLLWDWVDHSCLSFFCLVVRKKSFYIFVIQHGEIRLSNSRFLA